MSAAPGVVLPARAKLNLELEVVGRRDDGFHDLRTIFQAVDLHDLLTIEPAASTTLVITGFEVPDGGDNAVLIAQNRLERAAGRKLPAKFRLHKRIPAGSGMGGASSDAAATLRGLTALHGLDMDLAPVATQVGADVAFFLRGGAARASGRGEILHPLVPQRAWYAIAWPGFAVSTAAVYAAWDRVGGEPPNALRRAAELVEPRLRDFADELDRVGGQGGWQLTGSGSAFFRLCASRAEAVEATSSLTCWSAASCAVGAWA